MARGLTKRYGAVTALDDVTMEVTEGELVAVLGANGAGKTTLLESLVGLRSPDAGSAAIVGLDPATDPSAVGAACGVALQDGGVWPAVTPREALRLYARLYRNPWDIEALLAQAGLLEVADRRVRGLSAGQRQRLAVALALVGRPPVLVLDEPTSSTDLPGRESLWALLRAWRDAGAAVLLSTHLREEAEQLADRVAVLHRGRLVTIDRPHTIVAGARERLEVGVRGEVDAAALGRALQVPVEQLGAGRLRVSAGPERVPELATWLARHGAVVESLRTGGLADVLAELEQEEG